jgi:hypothetical protein
VMVIIYKTIILPVVLWVWNMVSDNKRGT